MIGFARRPLSQLTLRCSALDQPCSSRPPARVQRAQFSVGPGHVASVGFAGKCRIASALFPTLKAKLTNAAFARPSAVFDAFQRLGVFEQVAVEHVFALLARVALAHAQLWPGMPHARGHDADGIAVVCNTVPS